MLFRSIIEMQIKTRMSYHLTPVRMAIIKISTNNKYWLEESDTTERLHFHFSLSCFGEGNGNPLQYSCMENPMDRGAWQATVHGVSKSQEHPLEKEMATHSSTLAWKIPWMEEPGRLQSIWLQRVRHN